MFRREVGLLQGLKHENVISYYDVYEDVHFLYVVMELCSGGEVFAKIIELKRFREQDAAVLGRQMCSAIDYIHKLNIMHRDIKAENFMLADKTPTSAVKMIDFGMACKFTKGQVFTELCGSPHYLAPELIGQKYGHLVDCWAYGILLYLIMYGHYPYDAKHPRDIMVKVLTDPIKWQTKAKLSKDGLSFLKRLLEHNPKRRMTAEEALNHAWMQLAKVPETVTAEGTESLPLEVVRSAHKKVTMSRKQVDAKVEEAREQKLKKIDEDYKKGIRYGHRLGETPKEDFMNKPEFVRRANKLTTAPGKQITAPADSLLARVGGGLAGVRDRLRHGSGVGEVKKLVEEVPEDDEDEEKKKKEKQPAPVAPSPAAARGKTRAATTARMQYIGELSQQEEKKLASLWDEKKGLGVIPGSDQPGPSLPGAAED